jgi:hemerythrin superfamily protein
MDIYNYLKKDHKKVSSLFKKIIAEKSAKQREVYFLQVKKELELHADPENNTFYKALSKNSKGTDDAQHGKKEHSEIKKALAKLSKIPVKETVKWLVQFGELKHIVEHHVEDEETRMFSDGKKVISAQRKQLLKLKNPRNLLKKMLKQKNNS